MKHGVLFFCFLNTKMSNNVIALVAAIGVLALAVTVMRVNSKESFWNTPSRTWKVEKVLGVPADNCRGSDFFQSPNFQSILAPRFSNVDYGPYIRTVLPPYGAMGVPEDPLNMQYPSKEQFTHLNPRAKSCNDYADGNYNQVRDAIAQSAGGAVPASTIVSGDAVIMGNDGELKNPIVYDRYIFANRNSRLRAQGDKFRGDLPIAPNVGNWFTPSVHPNIDLEAGAINVMAGVNNQTSNQLANLIYNASGNAETAIGGVDMASVNQSFQTTTSNCAAGGDLNISGFP